MWRASAVVIACTLSFACLAADSADAIDAPAADASLQEQYVAGIRETGEISLRRQHLTSTEFDAIGAACRTAFEEGLDVEVWLDECTLEDFIHLDEWMVSTTASADVAESLKIAPGTTILLLPFSLGISQSEVHGMLCSPEHPAVVPEFFSIHQCNVLDHFALQDTAFFSTARFSNSVFKDRTAFANCVFLENLEFASSVVERTGSIAFSRTSLKGHTDFRLFRTESGILFTDCVIGGQSLFANALVNGDLVILDSEIVGHTDFESVVFANGVDLHRVSILRDCSFREAQFQGAVTIQDCEIVYVDWSEADFHESFTMRRCRSDGYLQFGGVEFRGNTLFSESQFEGHALFIGAVFHRAPMLVDVTLSSDAVLGRASFNQGAFFERVQFASREEEASAYLAASYGFDRVQDRRRADAYYYIGMVKSRQTMSRWDPRRWLEWLFVDLTMGYGVIWGRLPIAWLVVILFSAMVFWLGRGLYRGRSYLHARGFGTAIYYASTLFFGVGVSAYSPRGGYRYLAAFLGVFGKFLIGLLFAVLGRAYLR